MMASACFCLLPIHFRSCARNLPPLWPALPISLRLSPGRTASCLDEAVAYGDQGKFRLIDHTEFLFDVVEVGADRRSRQIEILRDSLHGGAPRQAHEHLEFAFRELIHRR